MGQIRATGANAYGQLGQGNTTPLNVFTAIGTLAVSQASCSMYRYAMAVAKNGSLWGWGSSAYYMGLGGGADPLYVPTRVGTATDWAQVACGQDHSLAIKTDGTLWVTGSNDYGQLGLGDQTFRDTWVQVGAATDWAKVVAGRYFSLALKTDGTLWAWGFNGTGQLGLGDSVYLQFTPAQVGSAAWLDVGAGWEFGAGIRSDGTLWAWGHNASYRLGDGTTTSRFIPVQTSGAAHAKLACGHHHGMAIRADGTLWAWGNNLSGCLGLSGTITLPTQVGGDTDWIGVSCGLYTSFAAKAGQVYATGDNWNGQLGLGDAQNTRTTLTAIPLTGPFMPVGGASFSLIYAGEAASPSWGLALIVDATLRPAWGLSLAVTAQTIHPSWGLGLVVHGTIQPSWGLRLQVADMEAMLGGPAHGWGYRARVGASDLSGRLIGPMRIGGEEGLSATATFSLRPTAGSIDPTAYVGQEVGLDYVWRSADGAVEQVLAMFLGVIDAVEIDVASFVLTLTAVDRRKDILAAGGEDLLPGSLWSPAVFDAEAAPLQQQEDRLSTLCAAFDILPDGSPALTSWQAKAQPDWSIGAEDYLWGSLEVGLASHDDLVQRVEARLDFRFYRLRVRDVRASYTFPISDILVHKVCPPGPDLVEAAFNATGLRLVESSLTTVPSTFREYQGVYYAFGGPGQVFGASAWLQRRFAQSVTESYHLTVDCAAAGIDARRKREVRGALTAEFDASAWEDDPGMAPVLPRAAWDVESVHDADDDPATGRLEAEHAIGVLLAQAQHLIRASHRLNRVSFAMRLNPLLNRTHTVDFAAAGVLATGKVVAVTHKLDPDAGQGTLGAQTVVTIALSRPSLATPSPSTLAPPVAPSPPAMDQATRLAHTLVLGNHIGARAASPAYDEAWQGYICNIPASSEVTGMVTSWGISGMKTEMVPTPYEFTLEGGATVTVNIDVPETVSFQAAPAQHYSGAVSNPLYIAANAYPWQFKITAPGVEDAARDHATYEVPATYLVDVPSDPFTLTAP